MEGNENAEHKRYFIHHDSLNISNIVNQTK